MSFYQLNYYYIPRCHSLSSLPFPPTVIYFVLRRKMWKPEDNLQVSVISPACEFQGSNSGLSG